MSCGSSSVSEPFLEYGVLSFLLIKVQNLGLWSPKCGSLVIGYFVLLFSKHSTHLQDNCTRWAAQRNMEPINGLSHISKRSNSKLSDLFVQSQQPLTYKRSSPTFSQLDQVFLSLQRKPVS